MDLSKKIWSNSDIKNVIIKELNVNNKVNEFLRIFLRNTGRNRWKFSEFKGI